MHHVRRLICLNLSRVHRRTLLVLALFTVASICIFYLRRGTEFANHVEQGHGQGQVIVKVMANDQVLTHTPTYPHPPAMINKNVRLPTVCQNLICKSEFLQHLHTSSGKYYPVPALRHLLWKSENVSEYFAQQLSTWQRIHPDWTVILWRDEDLKPFVSKHFPSALPRFLELAAYPIMQVDMIRYMLLYKYGGVYADLDYKLASSLDEHRQFYAVVTREPEVHSLQFYGMNWPIKMMVNPAFLMSAPGHVFFRYCIEWLQTVSYMKGRPLFFAGPLGLTNIVETYARMFPVANSPMETVYIPPSYSFHPYDNNQLNSSKSIYRSQRQTSLMTSCRYLGNAAAPKLREYCKDINNMDPITDRSQPIIAIHDIQKSGAIYDGSGNKFYFQNLTSAKNVLPLLQIGKDWI